MLLDRLGHVLVVLDLPPFRDDPAGDGHMVGNPLVIGRLDCLRGLARRLPLNPLVVAVGVLRGVGVAEQAVLTLFLVAAFVAVKDREVAVLGKGGDFREGDPVGTLQVVILGTLEEGDGKELVPLVEQDELAVVVPHGVVGLAAPLERALESVGEDKSRGEFGPHVGLQVHLEAAMDLFLVVDLLQGLEGRRVVVHAVNGKVGLDQQFLVELVGIRHRFELQFR